MTRVMPKLKNFNKSNPVKSSATGEKGKKAIEPRIAGTCINNPSRMLKTVGTRVEGQESRAEGRGSRVADRGSKVAREDDGRPRSSHTLPSTPSHLTLRTPRYRPTHCTTCTTGKIAGEDASNLVASGTSMDLEEPEDEEAAKERALKEKLTKKKDDPHQRGLTEEVMQKKKEGTYVR